MKKIPAKRRRISTLDIMLLACFMVFFLAFMLSLYAMIAGLDLQSGKVDNAILLKAVTQRLYLLGISMGSLIVWVIRSLKRRSGEG